MREIILFIAYKACGGKNFVWGKNPFQYRNATNLIGFIFILHVIQILLVIANDVILPIKSGNGVIYFVLIVCGMLLLYLSEKIFSKKILAKSISRYKESFINKYAKLIAYTYLSLNILILAGMVVVRNQ